MYPPPQPPPPHHHITVNSTTLSDVIYTAFSLFVFFSTSSKPNSKLSFPLNSRKFLKSSMSLPLRNPSNPNRLPHPAFATPQSLSDWLRPRLPSDSFASWGVKPGTKNIHNLWLEIAEGETSLVDSTPPVRTVEVVIVRIIGEDNKILVESHQELSNGVVRRRCRPLSEKMKPGETVEAAVFRAVKEELGSIVNYRASERAGDYGSNCVIADGVSGNSDNHDAGLTEISSIVNILAGSYVKKVEERVSASYPGLPACYLLHTVDAVVQGLPEGEFSTEEASEYGDSDGTNGDAVSCRKHFWKWVDSDLL